MAFPTDLTVAVLGGTGPQGRGLARRFAAATLAEATGGTVTGAANHDAAAAADVVVLAVPWDGHADLAREVADALSGKIVVDCVNPLGFDKEGAFGLDVEEGLPAEQAQALLPDARVVGAFHHVSAVLLEDPTVASVDTDVMVVGDDREATDLVQALAEAIPGVRGVFAGGCATRRVETLTANLISVNRRYKGHSGLRVTDV